MLSFKSYCHHLQRKDIWQRTCRDDSLLECNYVSPLEARDICRLLESASIGHLALIPVQFPEPRMYPRIIMPDHTYIALEQRIVSRIEPDQRRIQPDIRVCNVLAEQVWRMSRLAHDLLNPIQRIEQRIDILLVRLLRRRKARLVHAVVDRFIHPSIHLVNLRAQRFGIQPAAGLIDLAPFGRQQRVESGVEHADDLAALVVDNRLLLLVPQTWHGVA